MNDYEERAINDLYSAKVEDTDIEGVKDDFERFYKQMASGFMNNCINLSSCQIAFTVLAKIPKILRHYPNIRYFNLYGNLIRDEGLVRVFQIMEANPKITILDIGSNDLTDSCILCLTDIITKTSLESLQLGRKDLFFSQNWITREGLDSIIQVLIKTNKLKAFGICGIGSMKQKKTNKWKEFPQSVAALISKCTKLSSLDISECGFQLSDQRELAVGFHQNCHLRNLSVRGNSFSHGDSLINSVTTISTLRRLDVSKCSINPSAIITLSRKIKRGWELISLNISENNIKTEAINSLLDAVAESQYLVSLNISETYCDGAISSHLKRLMEVNEILHDLNLSKNSLGDDVAAVLQSTLENQKTLVNLNISGCKITDKGAVMICDALSKNTALLKVDMSDNFFTKDIGYDLLEMMQKNETILNLDLSANLIDCFAIEGFNTLCKRNRRGTHDKEVTELRKKYIKLSIQKAKIPGATQKLDGLVKQHISVREDLASLTAKMETFDLESSQKISELTKTNAEILKLIESEEKAILDTEEGIKKVTEESGIAKETVLDNIKLATEEYKRNEAYVAKMEQQIIDIETFHDKEKERLTKEIKLVEGLLKKIKDARADRDTLKYFEVPDFPYQDDSAEAVRSRIQLDDINPEQTVAEPADNEFADPPPTTKSRRGKKGKKNSKN